MLLSFHCYAQVKWLALISSFDWCPLIALTELMALQLKISKGDRLVSIQLGTSRYAVTPISAQTLIDTNNATVVEFPVSGTQKTAALLFATRKILFLYL